MKKTISLLMAVLLVLVIFTSCKTEEESETTMSPTNEATTAETKTEEASSEEAEALKLSVLGRQRAGITFEETKTVHAWEYLMDMFAEKNLTLDFTVVERDQFDTVLNATIASGEIPDFFYANGLSDADRINLIEQGIVMDIDQALEYSDGTSAAAFDEGGLYNISRRQKTYTDGGMYYFGNVSKQISVEKEAFGPQAVEANNWCMQIRQDWLDELGLPMPTTLNEFFDTLVAFQENDMNGNGNADERFPLYMGSPVGNVGSSKGNWGCYFDTGIAQWFGLANGVFQYNRATGKAEVPFLQDGFEDYISFLKKCVDAGLIYLGESNIKNNTGGNSDMDATMLANAVSAFFFLANANYANTPEEADFNVMPIIQGTEGVEPVMTGSVGYKVWSNWAFSSDANLKAVAAFLDTICSQNYAKFITFGVEGETYEIDKNTGMYKFTASNVVEDILKNKIARGYPLVIDSYLPDASQIGWYQEYNGPLSWNSYDEFVNSSYFNDVLSAKWGEKKTRNMIEWCEQADQLDMYNMNDDREMIAPMNTLEEAEVLEMYETDLITYMDEVFIRLLTGEFTLDEMDSYIEVMYSLGLQEVWDVRQAQYDRSN